ncbi:zinc ribbon domain-containing protein [Paenibacillus alkaliterrae]
MYPSIFTAASQTTTWHCSCRAELDRDVNAAINIKNEGCRMLGIA